MRETVLVRAATTGDLAGVARIYSHYVTSTVLTFEEVAPAVDEWRQRHQRITAGGLPFLVAEIDGRVVGYAYCSAWRPRPAYRYTAENSIYVAPRAVGQGVGRVLLARLLEAAAGAGVRQVIAVIVDSGDEASTALHKRFGFVPAGRLTAVGHKHGRDLDTLLWQRAL